MVQSSESRQERSKAKKRVERSKEKKEAYGGSDETGFNSLMYFIAWSPVGETVQDGLGSVV